MDVEAQPLKARERATRVAIVTVSDDQVRDAHPGLARAGLYVEPTAAACWAALRAGLIDIGQPPATGCGRSRRYAAAGSNPSPSL